MKKQIARITRTYPTSHQMEISTALLAVADKRTKHLWSQLASRPIGELLANAYLQGLTDGIDVLDQKGLLK
jgi:hypothetical protein